MDKPLVDGTNKGKDLSENDKMFMLMLCGVPADTITELFNGKLSPDEIVKNAKLEYLPLDMREVTQNTVGKIETFFEEGHKNIAEQAEIWNVPKGKLDNDSAKNVIENMFGILEKEFGLDIKIEFAEIDNSNTFGKIGQYNFNDQIPSDTVYINTNWIDNHKEKVTFSTLVGLLGHEIEHIFQQQDLSNAFDGEIYPSDNSLYRSVAILALAGYSGRYVYALSPTEMQSNVIKNAIERRINNVLSNN